MPPLFALCLVGLHNPPLATFAAFGTVAMLAFADFIGPPGARIRAYAILTACGVLLIASATIVSRTAWPAVAAMAAASIDITPGKPVPLAGYLRRRENFEGVSDRLEANLLALRAGDDLVLVGIDRARVEKDPVLVDPREDRRVEEPQALRDRVGRAGLGGEGKSPRRDLGDRVAAAADHGGVVQDARFPDVRELGGDDRERIQGNRAENLEAALNAASAAHRTEAATA